MAKFVVMIVFAGCASDPEPGYAGLEPGAATAVIEAQPTQDSNADPQPFTVATARVTGDPDSVLEVVFGDGGQRELRLSLSGSFTRDSLLTSEAVYRESETLEWVNVPPSELGGGINVEQAASGGFTFHAEYILHPGSADAVEQVILSARGDVAYP